MAKVLVTPRSFGSFSAKPMELLEGSGLEIVKNPTKSILGREQLAELIQDVDGIIVGVEQLDAEMLGNALRLRAISKYGVGIDNVDIAYCEQRNIPVSITKNANSDAVADYAFALMLAVARRVVEIDNACHRDDWSKRTSIDVYGRKLGILGLGNIGKGVARRAAGFAMDVFAYDTYKDDSYLEEHNITFASIEDIFKTCDFVSIHLPLVEETCHIVDGEMLALAKEGLVLVNTARGGVVDEGALYRALKQGHIYGAGLDVFEYEPPGQSPLLELDNVVVGSHSAASTVGAVDAMSMMAAENIVNALREKGVL